jgi:hypothetical protein
MSRTTRTLLIVLLFGGVAVVALGWVAGRYNAILEKRDETTVAGPAASHDAQVKAFIRVRTALLREIDPEGDGPPKQVSTDRMPELLERRDTALNAAGLATEDYLHVRSVYRDWRRRNMSAGEPLALPLERHRAQLEAVNLGPYESADL